MVMMNGRNGVGKWMALIVLALAIFNYFILNTLHPGGLMAYVLPSACWGFLALVALKISFGRIRPWFSAHVSIAAASVAILYVIILMNIGIFTSFGRSTQSFTSRDLIFNLTLFSTTLLGMEFSRACLVKSFGKNRPFLTIGVVTLLYTFLSISTVKLMGLNDPLGFTKFMGIGFLPVIAENLLASYLAFIGGPTASLAYRGPLMAFWWFCPILPHLSWGVEALLGVMVPTIGFFAINQYTSPMALRRLGIPVEIKGFGKNRKSSAKGWIIVGILCVLMVWASTGLLGIRPTTVISGSMSPTMDVGDMAIVRDVSPDSITPGSIIQFWQNGEMIVHRVVNVSGSGQNRQFVTKGDANAEPDLALVSSSDVKGEVVMNIPKIGWAAIAVKGFFSDVWALLSAIPTLTVFTIGSGALVFYSFRTRKKRFTRGWHGAHWRRSKLGGGKLMAPVSLLLVVMAVTGFAYAHWSKTVYINLTITTGHFKKGHICGYKFYDNNANGKWDNNEPPIEGFKIELWLGGSRIAQTTTGRDGHYCFDNLDAGTYTVKEVLPCKTWCTWEPCGKCDDAPTQGVEFDKSADCYCCWCYWENTTPKEITIILVSGESSENNNFGNVCLKPGCGGHTIGFWTSCNGQSLITLDYVKELNKENFYKPNGWTYPPFDNIHITTARTQIKNYLLSANAVDMRWMLSAQLIATKLNVLKGFLCRSTIVYVGPSTNVPSGFISIGGIIENADVALSLPHPAYRSLQEFWKNVLDNLNNNNFKFVSPKPCPVVY